MNRKPRLTAPAFSLTFVLAGLALMVLAVSASITARATAKASSVSVSITESGLNPSTVTVTVGTAVVWTNHTQETVHLASGEPHRIYLPLVLNGTGIGTVTMTPHPIRSAGVTRQLDDWGGVNIAPDDSYTHTFTTVGNYPYYLVGHPHGIGEVVVQPPPDPDFALGIQPLMQEVMQGQSVTYTVAVTALYGFEDPVTLDIGSLPANTDFSWSTNPVIPTADASLTITPSMSSPTGAFTPIITGTGGEQEHSLPFSLTIFSPPQLFDSVLHLDGADDFAYAVDSVDVDIGDDGAESLTVEGWFNILDLNPSEERYKVVACKWQSYCLVVHQRPNQPIDIQFRVWESDSSSIRWIVGAGYLAAGWHHVAAVFDNPADELRLYYGGERLATSSVISTSNLNNSAYEVFVGGLSGGDYLDGTLEEVRLSDTAQYSGDTYPLPGAPFACDAGTRALWHFDEAAGATVFYDGEDGAGSGCGTVEDTSVGTNGASTGP